MENHGVKNTYRWTSLPSWTRFACNALLDNQRKNILGTHTRFLCDIIQHYFPSDSTLTSVLQKTVIITSTVLNTQKSWFPVLNQ